MVALLLSAVAAATPTDTRAVEIRIGVSLDRDRMCGSMRCADAVEAALSVLARSSDQARITRTDLPGLQPREQGRISQLCRPAFTVAIVDHPDQVAPRGSWRDIAGSDQRIYVGKLEKTLPTGAGHRGVLFAADPEGIHTAIAEAIQRAGQPAGSSPREATAGELAVHSWAEGDPDHPLMLGHLQALTEQGVTLWQAGQRLSERPVLSAERNEDDRDGTGSRDIYTWMPGLEQVIPAEDRAVVRRTGLDRTLVELVRASPALQAALLPVDALAAASPYDLDRSGQVDVGDLQQLIDFTRGLPQAPFRYLDRTRGSWRLGDVRSRAVLVRAGEGRPSPDPSYRTFRRALASAGHPDLVLQAANDGLLHAFDLEDGAERWAWAPAGLLRPSIEGRLWGAPVTGTERLLEGIPVVEDVWIDHDGDGLRTCTALPDDCEWHRVVVVGQGAAGSGMLALDITDPTAPLWLWEVPGDPDVPGSDEAVVAELVGVGPAVIWGSGSLTIRTITGTPLAVPTAPMPGRVRGTPTAIDTNEDGLVDVIYAHITDRYSLLHKLVLNDDSPSGARWCALQASEHESIVDQPVTAAWTGDGALALFWGAAAADEGTPGRFFAARDVDPRGCKTVVPQCEEGTITLSAGDGLTAAPIVYAGVVYFTTWSQPECSRGTGQLWAMTYDRCAPSFDTPLGPVASRILDHHPISLTITAAGRLSTGTQPDEQWWLTGGEQVRLLSVAAWISGS